MDPNTLTCVQKSDGSRSKVTLVWIKGQGSRGSVSKVIGQVDQGQRSLDHVKFCGTCCGIKTMGVLLLIQSCQVLK